MSEKTPLVSSDAGEFLTPSNPDVKDMNDACVPGEQSNTNHRNSYGFAASIEDETFLPLREEEEIDSSSIQSSPQPHFSRSPDNDNGIPVIIAENKSPIMPSNSSSMDILYEFCSIIQSGDTINLTSFLYTHPVSEIINSTHPLFGIPPLTLAAHSGSAESVRLLIMAGANPNIHGGSDGIVPLHLAAANGNIDCIYMLIRAGANVSVTDDHGSTPLVLSIVEGRSQAFMVLLAQLFENENTSISVCEFILLARYLPKLLPSALSFPHAVLKLLEKPSPDEAGYCFVGPDIRECSSLNVLFSSAEFESPNDVVTVLMAIGSAMVSAGIIVAPSAELVVTQLALEMVYGYQGLRSNLALAAEFNAVEVIAACLNVCHPKAIYSALPELMRWSAKGKMNRSDDSKYFHRMSATSLFLVAGDRQGKINSLVDCKDPDHGSTPLQLASLYGNPNTVLLLLCQGADHKITDVYGRTAADLAGLRLDSVALQIYKDEMAKKKEALESSTSEGDAEIHVSDDSVLPDSASIAQKSLEADVVQEACDHTPILQNQDVSTPKEKQKVKTTTETKGKTPMEKRLAAALENGPLPSIIRQTDVEPRGVMESLHILRWNHSLMVRLNSLRPYGIQMYAVYWILLAGFYAITFFNVFNHQSSQKGVHYASIAMGGMVAILLVLVRLSNPGFLPRGTRSEQSIIAYQEMDGDDLGDEEEVGRTSCDDVVDDEDESDNARMFYEKSQFSHPIVASSELHTILEGCPTCISKPVPRSKHSRYNNRCVAGFDHYCPWVQQDIGASNHRMFFGLLTVSTMLGCTLFIWSMIQIFFFPARIGLNAGSSNRDLWKSISDRPMLFFLIIGLPIFAVYLVLLWITQLRGILTNLTQNEVINMQRYEEFKAADGQFYNPYHEGSSWKNLKAFFSGKRRRRCMMMLPPTAAGRSMGCGCGSCSRPADGGEPSQCQHQPQQSRGNVATPTQKFQSPVIDVE